MNPISPNELHENEGPCFGKVIDGQSVLDAIYNMPRGRSFHFKVKSVRILAPESSV